MPITTHSIVSLALAFAFSGAVAVADPSPAASASPGASSSSASPSTSPSPTAKPVYQDMQWREVGSALPGGRAANVAGSARNINLYYVAAAGGGVWKTTDGGETWQAVFEKEAVASISDVVIDPSNDSTVWVATGEGNPRNDVIPGAGVYKTIDGGKTWQYLGLKETRTISRLLIDPRNPNHVLVAAIGDIFAPSPDRGIYVTDDGGKTWQKTLYVSDQSGGSDMVMDPKNSNVIYAGIWHFMRKPWTTNSGGSDDGLYKSTDGGRTWSKQIGHGLPTDTIGRIGLAIAPSDNARIYATIESKQGILWRSDDGGANWTKVSDDTLVNQRPFYFSHIYVDPKNPDHVYGVSAALSQSRDGGKTFKVMQNSPHGDFHGMWIAPDDPNRIMVAEDGGVARSLDGGHAWFFGRNLPVGEVYHVGVGARGNPYWICGGWQDNNAWCGPAFSTDPSGTQNKHWVNAAGGDGEWAIPDPLDPDILWADSQGASINVYNKRTRDGYSAIPYLATADAQFDIAKAKYRFNWDSPIAFAPWDGHIAWAGGNVVFQTSDRGRSWIPISPDLTRNEKEHQAPPGGPITHDVSSAENYNTILDIEGSPLRRGEIWVGTDDGLVQYTPDGGKHWRNVTPKLAPDHGEAETVAPSTTTYGTVYAGFDKHLLGDYKPYMFVTHDSGKTWQDISNGIPAGQYVRSVRQDLRNRNIVYAGTETGFWISCDAGSTWHDFKNNLPTVAVRDIRYQPQWDDMVIATHGRAMYVMDDLRPLQQSACSKPDAPFAIAPRISYEYNLHGDDEGIYTDYAAANPPFGATITYYQPVPSRAAPVIRIYTGSGNLIRTISGVQDNPFGSKPKPWIANEPGLQHFTWDFSEDGPVKWNGAGKFFRGPDEGAMVVPGTYAMRMTLGGRTFTERFVVKPDPDTHFTQAELLESYALSHEFDGKFSSLDAGLNALDDVKSQLEKARTAASAKSDAATVSAIDAALGNRQDLQDSLTANYQNFEDSIQRPGKLREDLGAIVGSNLITPPVRDLAIRVRAEYAAGVQRFKAYVATLAATNAMLQKGGYGAVTVPKGI
ncbi:MAG: hypothetical protein M3R51_07100 [Candidatus Eremiobacteraeota bacterium]|nr:hypothetical protein [Candidatus Eremiobacteraeota bacterium]